jgi:hypothetical protein
MISRRMMLAGLLAGAAFPAVAEVMDSSPAPVRVAARPRRVWRRGRLTPPN